MKFFPPLHIRCYLSFILSLVTILGHTQDYKKFGVDANYDLPKGLKIGDKAPPFVGLDQRVEEVSLQEKLNQGKVIVMFYRGYWCPHCSRSLSEFQDSLSLLLEEGVTVIAITPESKHFVDKTVSKNNLSFSVISDTTGSIMTDYKVLFNVTNGYSRKLKLVGINIAKNNDQEEPQLPVPATYVIGQDGTIEYVFFNYDYTLRASVKELLEHLR